MIPFFVDGLVKTKNLTTEKRRHRVKHYKIKVFSLCPDLKKTFYGFIFNGLYLASIILDDVVKSLF